MKASTLFNARIRKYIADFGPTVVILAMSVFASLPALKNMGLDFLAVPSSLSLSSTAGAFNIDHFSVPWSLRLAAAIPALPLTLLFYLDQVVLLSKVVELT